MVMMRKYFGCDELMTLTMDSTYAANDLWSGNAFANLEKTQVSDTPGLNQANIRAQV